MALIYRSLAETDDPDFPASGRKLFEAWIRWKLRLPSFELPASGQTAEPAEQVEVACAEGEEGGAEAFRGHIFERRDGEEVRTSFTALSGEGVTWSWVDLERWADDAFGQSWVPYSPGMVTQVLRHTACRRGPSRLREEHVTLEGQAGSLLRHQVTDPERLVPLVVVSPRRDELDGDMAPAHRRAQELQRRLAGIAPVYLLGSGAVSEFSRAMLEVDRDFDVRSGAVRTYLPGAGDTGDNPRRHRYVPFHRLEGRPADMAARLVSLPIMRAASQQSPPRAWLALRNLPEFSGAGVADADLSALSQLADEDRARAEEAENRAEEAEFALEMERETVVELLGERDTLVARLRYAETQVRERGGTVHSPSEDETFRPDFCSEAVEQAEGALRHIVVGPDVRNAAEELDVHAQPSWARKAWRAFEAFDAYAMGKAAGEVEGNFLSFCERVASTAGIPTSWLAPSESKTTDQNPRFRALRTFAVDTSVDTSGCLYMPAHVKIEKGGSPAPRIHFFDDTGGPSGKVHIGWFGPHRDNKSKS